MKDNSARKMPSKRARLDRFLSDHLNTPRKTIKPLLARGRVRVDGAVVKDVQLIINQFSRVELDQRVLQANTRRYIMLNKPAGVVSATKDPQHTTVMDLLDEKDRTDMHIAGRLDFNSTGLLLLTNDGRWSQHLSAPENNISKRYRVTVEKPLTHDYVQAFSEGMFFEYEGITTKPVRLDIISDHVADVMLMEGRYHQIKRMFGRFQNEVLSLHRSAIGHLQLDENLLPGQSRPLSENEVQGC